MNEKRLAVVKHAWSQLDKSQTGRVPLRQLCQSYNAQSHPRVLTREKKQETVYNDFENCMGARS